jgi:hypothetical protein
LSCNVSNLLLCNPFFLHVYVQYLQKKRKYGAVDNMTSTATISSSALRQNQRKKTMAMTNMQEIRKRTLDGAVACTSNGNV